MSRETFIVISFSAALMMLIALFANIITGWASPSSIGGAGIIGMIIGWIIAIYMGYEDEQI